MQLKQLNKILFTSMISICTANMAFGETKTSDITHDVVGFEQSAYGEVKGIVATKSSTGSKMDVDVQEIPQSVSIITNDMMRTRNAQGIQNITAYTAAISQPYGENSELRSNYGRIRGLGHLYKSSFLDGLKLLYNGHLIPKIDPYSLERVEVLKGPASVLYGASGPGGLLNLQSKKPNDSLSKEIGVSYGTYNNKTVFADFNEKINENVLVRLTGKFKKGDNELQKSTNESYFFNPSLTYLIDDDTTLDVYTSLAKDEIKGLGVGFNGGKAILNYHNSIAKNVVGIKAYVNANTAHTSATDAFYINNVKNSATAVNALNLPSDMFIGLPDDEIFEKNYKSVGTVLSKNLNENLKFKTNLRLTKMNGKNDYSIPSSSGLLPLLADAGANPDLTKLPVEFIQIDADLKSFAIDNNLEYKWDTTNTQNTSLLGLDFQYSEFDQQTKEAVQYKFDLANPNAAINIAKTSTLNSNYVNKLSQLGLYAQNHMKINDKFVLSSSLRYDKLENEKDDKITGTSTSQKDNNLSGRLGFTYLFDNGIAPYTTYSTSFQANSGASKAGDLFEPSVGEQIEVGIKYKPENMNALFTIAAYNMKESKLVKTDPNNDGYQIQQGDAKVKGIGFDVVANPTDNTNLTFSFSKISGKEVNMPDPDYEGRVLNDLPKFTTSVWADYTFRNTSAGDVKIGAGVKHVGKAKNQNTDHFDFANGRPNKLFDVGAYTTVDALLATQYKDWNIALNVNNVFDDNSVLDTNTVTSKETSSRTFTLTASYKF